MRGSMPYSRRRALVPTVERPLLDQDDDYILNSNLDCDYTLYGPACAPQMT